MLSIIRYLNPLRWRARPLHGSAGRRDTALVAPTPRASYDAAKPNGVGKNHFAGADSLSASRALTPHIRHRLCIKARCERDNDPHLAGLIKTIGQDLIGTGPRLQLLLGEGNQSARDVERQFAKWMRATGLMDKFRVMAETRPIDGEVFGLLINNPSTSHPVKLDVRLIEAEQVDTPYAVLAPGKVDGVEIDASGNVSAYHVLKTHPGDGWVSPSGYDRVPADQVLHWFRPNRPGQYRGVCELASALEIGAQTRRYATAVLTAAEFAASIAGVLETSATVPGGDAPPSIESMEEIPLTAGSLLTLPDGVQAKQLQAEQPVSSYEAFVSEKRGELARPLLAPRNVVLGNSSGYNYSSGRLDFVPYHRMLWIERERFRNQVLDKILRAWLAEASAVGLIPTDLPPMEEWEWDYHWDAFNSIDPVKDVDAAVQRMAAGISTLSEECAAEGKSWRDVVDQRAIELEYMRSKGVPVPGVVNSQGADSGSMDGPNPPIEGSQSP